MAKRTRGTKANNTLSRAIGRLPAPLRFVLQSRYGIIAAMLVTGTLVGYGVIKIHWQDGKPHVEIDARKAAALRERTVAWIQATRGKLGDLATSETRPADAISQGPTASHEVPPVEGEPLVPQARPPAQLGAAPPFDTIRIASFNIQVFGTSKLAKTEVMQVLVQVVRQFDVVAIQEVRSKDDTVLPRFVASINADGAGYDFVIGPRLGRTSSKEQYAFVFDTSRIERDPNVLYTLQDPQDVMHREPLVARFRARTAVPERGFSFTLINVHTDPDETDTEVDVLASAFQAVRQDGSGEDDVILLGDLNVDEHHLGQLGMLPGVVPAISGVPTNTRRNRTYDNLIMDARTTTEFTGVARVLDLQEAFGLTLEHALEVSDHSPIWAEFSAHERPGAGPVAARPQSGTQ
jgi:endonuclease/exonuclease/phosphatase family metal-dependent hydrolase